MAPHPACEYEQGSKPQAAQKRCHMESHQERPPECRIASMLFPVYFLREYHTAVSFGFISGSLRRGWTALLLQAQGWKKDLLRRDPPTAGCRVAMVACAHPDNYQRLLKPELDPEPWRYLYPLFVKGTPTEVISMHHLVEAISAATAEVHTFLTPGCSVVRVVVSAAEGARGAGVGLASGVGLLPALSALSAAN